LKRWGTIHDECSKFQGSIEKIKKRKISGLSAVEMVKPLPPLLMYLAYALSHCYHPYVYVFKAMGHFKAAYDNKAFILSHCWIELKDSKNWEDSFSF
jgi:hypothetical protein